MKKLFLITTFIFVFSLAFPTSSFTQGMMGGNTINSDGHTAREEAEGKIVWEKLQAKELTCKDLSNDNFGTLGEYFMGQIMGNSHEAMNNMMIQMMGEESEEQMHIVMGKRMSNCEPDAPMPQNMPAPYGTAGSRSGMNNGMMGGRRDFGFFGWIFMILWWTLIIAGIVAFIKWLVAQSRGESHGREKLASLAGGSPLDILKERYARGEIDKKEFEDKKKDLS